MRILAKIEGVLTHKAAKRMYSCCYDLPESVFDEEVRWVDMRSIDSIGETVWCVSGSESKTGSYQHGII